jgi:hypothetical protein
MPIGQQRRATRAHRLVHHPRLAWWGGTDERVRTVSAQLSRPVHERALRHEQRLASQVDGTNVAVFHQRGQCETARCRVATRVREVVVPADKVCDSALLLENAQCLTDIQRAIWRAGNQRLFEHGKLDCLKRPKAYAEQRPATSENCQPEFLDRGPTSQADQEV